MRSLRRRINISSGISTYPGVYVTLSTFACKRCHGTVLVPSRRTSVFEYTVAPIILINYYRCEYCTDRFATFGVGKFRHVISRKTSRAMRTITRVALIAVIVGALVGLLIIR